jgi:acyl-CoA synthetase (AMP-forming)/AMP-acid ligase II
MAISLATYVEASRRQAWLVGLPAWRWEGLTALLTPLFLGAPAVLLPEEADESALAETIVREGTAFVFHDLEPVALAAREAKKEAKRARDVLSAFLLSIQGSFEPDQRRRVGKAFDSPALTVYGLPETGPIFVAHPSWYLDESVGLPLTNAHVVPADPRTGAPIQTLWELVESAEVTVASPMLFCGYEEAEHPDRFVDGRYRTRMIASSDPNGMIYLLGE